MTKEKRTQMIEELAKGEADLVSRNNNGSNDRALYVLRKKLDLLRRQAARHA